jgi:ABC-type transport system involved in multi-copper enzyme maturation permease subunit
LTSVDRTSDRHPAQWLALAIGIAYAVAGLVGFALTGFRGFAEPGGELLLGVFEINPLHNVVHLVIGVAGVALWRPLARARLYGWLLAAGYGLTFLYGLFVAGSDEPANFLALNQGDNWLHLFSALAGLAIALWPARARSRPARP